MNAPVRPPHEDEETPSERRVTNIMLAVFFLLLVGSGIWIVDVMVDTRKSQDCVLSGRRNCADIPMPGRE